VRRKVVLLSATVLIIVGSFVATLLSDNRPVLGLDLQGGISIVLFPEAGGGDDTLEAAADVIRNRVEGLGVSEPEVNVQGDTIVVDLPGVKDRQAAERLVGQTAELRFRPVVNFIPASGVPTTTTAPPTTTTAPGATTTTAPGATTTTAPGATTTTAPGATTTTAPGAPTTVDENAAGRTVVTAPIAATRPAQTPTTAAPATPPSTAATPPTTTAPGATTTTTAPPAPGTTCDELVTPPEEDIADQPVILPTKETEGDQAGCYQLEPTVLTGGAIGDASARFEPGQGWTVQVTFKENQFVDTVATPYVNRQVAIVLDSVVQSAPLINPGITGNDVQITGDFTEREAKDLALVLRYGALPVKFDAEQQTVQSVSPTLGEDQLRAGLISGLVGLLLVALYMLAFYRVLALVVIGGLALTGMLFFTLTSYLSTNAGLTLTLAGVTGIIVSVGVTVDSYVVYFERLKDEVRTGKTVRSSIDTGFQRAFRTIVAADLVSLLGAGVLYFLAAGSVRGFAFFLGLSTAIDLVLAYTYMWPLVGIMSRSPGLVRAAGVGIEAGLDVRAARA